MILMRLEGVKCVRMTAWAMEAGRNTLVRISVSRD